MKGESEGDVGVYPSDPPEMASYLALICSYT